VTTFKVGLRVPILSSIYAANVTAMKASVFNMEGNGSGAVSHSISRCIYFYLNLMMLLAAQNLQHQIKVLGKKLGYRHSKGNKTVPAKVATTCTEDGDKQTTKAGAALYTKRTKEPRTTEEEMD